MTRYLIALTLALALSFFDLRWRVDLPPLPQFAPSIAPAQAATLDGCIPFGTVGTIIIARCTDEETGITVIANSAGMIVGVDW